MRDKLRNLVVHAVNFSQQIGDDLGTVCLGASAIFLVRAFPVSVCDQCQEFDLRMIAASGFFLALGLVIRYVSKSGSN